MTNPTDLQPPTPTDIQRREFRRSGDESSRVLGGVSGGIASYFGLHQTVVRLSFLIFTPIFFLGVLVYLPIWLLAPDTQGRIMVRSGARSVSETVLAALMTGVFSFGMFVWLPIGDPASGSAFIVALLAAVAVALLSAPPTYPQVHADTADVRADPANLPAGTATTPARSAPVDELPPTESESAEPAVTGHNSAQSSDNLSGQSTPQATPQATPQTVVPQAAPVTTTRRSSQVKPPKPPRPRAFMGPAIVAVSLIVAGVGLLLRGLTDITVHLSDVLVAVLIVMGIGMLITTWFGRARGIVLVGLVLIPITLMSATVDRLGISGEIGNDRYTPQFVAAIPTTAHLDAGSVEVDLRYLDDAPMSALHNDIDMNVTVRFGTIRIFVPTSWNLTIESTTRFGSVYLFEDMWVEPEYTEEQWNDESFVPESRPWDSRMQSRDLHTQHNPSVWVHAPHPVSLTERTSEGSTYRDERFVASDAPTLNIHTSSVAADIEIIRADLVESES